MEDRLAGFATDATNAPIRLDENGYPFHQKSFEVSGTSLTPLFAPFEDSSPIIVVLNSLRITTP